MLLTAVFEFSFIVSCASSIGVQGLVAALCVCAARVFFFLVELFLLSITKFCNTRHETSQKCCILLIIDEQLLTLLPSIF